MLDAPVRRALEVRIQKAQILFVALLSSLVVTQAPTLRSLEEALRRR